MRVMSNEKVSVGCAGGALVLVRCVESGGGCRRKAGVFRLRTSGGAVAARSRASKVAPSLRKLAASGSDLSFASGVATSCLGWIRRALRWTVLRLARHDRACDIWRAKVLNPPTRAEPAAKTPRVLIFRDA